ncbi:MAG: hypothetical protein JWM68_2754 [Verrucomicrobiales bacterium]|nr:hypothetical protein [Verrucomicrobiales bacterium]
MRYLCVLIGLLFAWSLEATASTNLSHPRLYFTSEELPKLQKLRKSGVHAKIYKNLIDSADWCLTKTPRKAWIAPVSPDPIYENLYDRFYGIMGDLAITEHLAFAYALSGKPQYGEATRQWVLSSCRVWQREAEGQPDGGKAYSVSRLLKGISVGYDLAWDRFSEAERKEIQDTLVRIGRLYFEKYFQTPTISGPGFHTHHAVVEWSSFGVMALTLLNETPEAQKWLDATTRKFEEHLLPTGLAPDGAQVEGGSFWASTMQYRLFFMDPLRRVTGRDLFARFEKQMNADLALASIASINEPGYHQSYANIVQQPYYAQLDYYAPILLFLAREYRQPMFQYFALWDRSLGHIQKTRAITPHGEQLSFELGGYAYVWYDATVRPKAENKKLSYHFPSVDEAYLRASWKPDDLLVGVWKGQIIVHAGGRPVLIETYIQEPVADLKIQSVRDDGNIGVIQCGTNETNRVTIELNRTKRTVTISRNVAGDWTWWCQGKPSHEGNDLRWDNKTFVHVREGAMSEFLPEGYAPLFATGFNKLKLLDPLPMKFPKVTIKPSANNRAVLEVGFGKPKRQ